MRSGHRDGLGTPLHRMEDPRLITGRGRYVDDLHLEGTLHAAFVRSPEAHALIRSIDTSEATQLSGVVGVWVASDLSVERAMPNAHPHPSLADSRQGSPLAVEEVCYVGEPVAVVVAENRYIAADALDLIWVEYEPLPVSAQLEAALADGAASVHQGSSSNLVTTLKSAYGDIEAAFATAEVVLPIELHQHRGACASMETRGVVAVEDSFGLTLWSSTQAPAGVRHHVSAYFGRDDVRVIAPDVGGGFGPKAGVYAEEYVLAALAGRVGAPVKWVETRREHFLTTHQQRDVVSYLEVAASADGRLLGLRGRLLHDNGAYVPYGVVLPMTGIQLVQGPYTLDAMALTMDVVYTNAVPTAPIRGAARPNANFIIERAIDAVAGHLDIDRAEIRRRNFIPADAFPYEFPLPARYGGNITYDSGDYHQALDEVLRIADYQGFERRRQGARAMGRRLGIGVAAYVEDTGLGPFEQARVELDDQGMVVVSVATGSQGQGHATVFAQICASELGVDPRTVTVRQADTDLPGNGGATVASRTAVTAGSSTFAAAASLAGRLRTLAAAHLEAAEGDIVLEDGHAGVAGVPGTETSFAELAGLARARGEQLSEDGEFPTPRPPYAFGCHVAEVEVDEATGHVDVVRYSVAHDCGTLLNPLIVDGQIDGGVAHGISNALFERIVYGDDGQPRTTTFMDFRIPTAVEMPQLTKLHTVTPSPDNPLGAKGAGEGGTIPAMAAIVSAVEDALSDLSVTVDRYPLTPNVVRGLIEDAAGAEREEEPMTADVIETELGAVSLERVGAGPDLIMLHSLLSDRHVFDPVVGRLAELWTVNLVDLPGFGSTAMVPPNIDAYADLVGAMLGNYDPATTTLLGNGLGAFVALGTAIRHGSRFDRLVLVGCGAGFPDEAKGAFRTMVARVGEDGMEAVLDIAVRRIFTADFLAQHPEMAEQRRTVLRRTIPAAFENACRALEHLDYGEQAQTVANPTLVVVGSDDEATPPPLGRDLAERIPDAVYIELPNVAHAPQLQDPAAFLAAVVPFLEPDQSA